jgi:hypothetical protein
MDPIVLFPLNFQARYLFLYYFVYRYISYDGDRAVLNRGNRVYSVRYEILTKGAVPLQGL